MKAKAWVWFMGRCPSFAGARWRTDTAQQSYSVVTLKDRWQYDIIIITLWKYDHWWEFIMSLQMRTCIFQLGEGQEWGVRGKAYRRCCIPFIWKYRSTFTLWNFYLCLGRLICVGSITGFSDFQLGMASRDIRQEIRTTVRSLCLFLWVFSCEFTLNYLRPLTRHHCQFQGHLLCTSPSFLF